MSACDCHGRLFSSMKMAKQLAVKYLRDKKHFDLAKWIEIRGKGPEEVVMEDVITEANSLDLPCIGQKTMRF